MSIEIVSFEEKYAKELSKIILENMYKINIKEHGKDVIDKLAKHFIPEEIIKNFPNREKCFVALKDNEVVGTASIAKFKGDVSGNKYIILTVFVDMNHHYQGIGKRLIENIENTARAIGCKELVIPAYVSFIENLDLIISMVKKFKMKIKNICWLNIINI